MHPKVSIIIPAYNRATIITQTLDSLLQQTYSNWECIVVDDGSTDDTVFVINTYKKKDHRFNHFLRPKEKLKGPSSCRNYGLEKANGDYIVFLDSDDLLAPFCLEERLKVFGHNKGCDFLVYQMEVFKKSKPNYVKKKVNKVNDNYLESFILLNSIWKITSPIYKISFIKYLNGFDESLIIYEDLELAIRAINNSNKFKVFDSIDCYYRNNKAYFEKQIDFNFITNIVNSFENYCYAFHSNSVLKQDDIKIIKRFKRSLVSNYKKVFKTYMLQFMPCFFKQNKIILTFLNANGYLSFVEKKKFYFVQKFLLKFYKFKGYGLFRIVNYLMRDR
ncbi:MAG: glycosyltransferase family 2 protein [Algibacter sp.]